MTYDNQPYTGSGGFQRYRNITELDGAALRVSEGGTREASEVQAEVNHIAANRPYLAMRLTQLSELYQRLLDVQRQGISIGSLADEISNEAWKIGNEASPYYDQPAYAARRDR